MCSKQFVIFENCNQKSITFIPKTRIIITYTKIIKILNYYNMKHITLILAIIFSSICANAQGWMWAKQFNGTGNNQPTAIVQDNSGNYYVYGNFKGTVNQDAITLNSYSNTQDIFLSKYNSQGVIQWIKQIGSTGAEVAIGLVLSHDGNSILVSGQTNGMCSFDGGFTFTSEGLNDIFLAKFDLNGSCQWAHNTAYGITMQLSGALTIDDNENIIMTGVFIDNVTFYGGTASLTSLYSGVRQNFIAKFDGNGNYSWSKLISSDNASTEIKSVSAFNNEYYFSGRYIGNVDIDGNIIENYTTYADGMVFKLNTSGSFQWVKTIVGTSSTEYPYKHVNDESGNVYVAGYYLSSQLDIDGTLLNNTSSGTTDIFIIKYNSSGILQWAKNIGSNADDKVLDIHSYNNNVILTGSYSAAINFDIYPLTNSGGTDAFIAECDASGNFINAIKAAGTGNDNGEACLYTKNGRNFVATGDFYSNTFTIGTNTFTNSIQDLTTRDAYIARYGCFDGVSISPTNVSCFGGNNGAATAIPSEGLETDYTYAWSNSETTATISNLTAGTYSVTVTRIASTCNATASVTITQPAALTATTSQNNGCNGSCNKTATVIPSDGTLPYTYHWNNGQTGATATELCTGNYSVTVTDGCTNTSVQSVTITDPTVLTATTSQVEPSLTSCDGTATVSPSGGTSPYTYLWSNAQTTNPATGICGGTCSVTVTDANGCTTTKSYTFKKAINLRVVGTPTTNSATFAWDGSGADMYRLRFNVLGSTSYFYSNVYTSPYTKQLLEANTTYECCITTKIGSVYSPYSSPVTFTTTIDNSVIATNLRMVGTPTSSSATVAWDGSGATSYQLRLNIAGSSTYTYKTVYTSPYTFDLLQPNTNYDCCIRTFYGGTYNSMSSPISFSTTNEVTVIATNLRIEGIPTTNSATLAWDGSGADRYRLRFKKQGSSTYLYSDIYASPFTRQLLEPNSTYECSITTYVSGVYTAYSSPITFTTANGISYLATNLRVVGSPTANSAILAWDGSGAMYYQLRFNVVGSTSYSYVKVYTGSPYTKLSLTPGTNYNCCIMTYVSSGVYTSYSSPVTFTTASSKNLTSIEDNKLIGINIYPNPVKTFLSIEIEAVNDGKYTMEISDITGRVIMNVEGYVEGRFYIREKDVSEWKSGIYFLRIYYGEEVKTIKFIKE